MDYKNFFIPEGNVPVKIDQILVPGETYNFDISLKVDTMRAANPDSAIDKLDLELEVSIPTQKVTIPLDGSSLGGMGLTIRFGSLVFKELEANIVQGFPSVPQDQEMQKERSQVTLFISTLRYSLGYRALRVWMFLLIRWVLELTRQRSLLGLRKMMMDHLQALSYTGLFFLQKEYLIILID